MAVYPVKATDISISQNGKLIGCQQSVTLSLTKEELDAVCSASGNWSETVGGRKSWNISLDALLREATGADAATNITYHDSFDIWNGDDLVDVEFKVGLFMYSGTAIMLGLDLNTSATDTQTWSSSLKGTGPLNKVAIV